MVTFKTSPFAHQLEEYEAHKDTAARGLLWEPGCGKTWPSLNKAAYLEEQGEIMGLLVLAPNGVHRNWVVDQIPQHLPDELAERTRTFLWQTSKAKNKGHQDAAQEALDHEGFTIVCMSYDAVMTELGFKFWKKFLNSRRCKYVLDESPRIKTPGSKRSMRIAGSSKAAPYREILTGTIVDDKPFDVYNQIRFLDPTVWHELGCLDFTAFKATFGEWKRNEITYRGKDGKVKQGHYDQLLSYRNMDLLAEIVARYGSRLRKEDILDLPPKLYSKRYFDLPPSWARAYRDLQRDFYTFLESGELVAADLVITRMLRLQQITSGYLPSEEEERLVPFDGPNPRVRLLLDVLKDLPHQAIVWAKYKQDITSILEALRKAEISAVRYDGQCTEDEAGQAVDDFKRGNAQVFVANPQKGAEGITLTCAKTMVYYNNGPRLSLRTQSEDRAHRIGQEDPVHIIDLAATDTVDVALIDLLRKKYEWAAMVQGDEVREWI